MCPRSIEEKDEHPKNKEVAFIILQKNMRSMHSSEKIEELVTETRRIQMGRDFIE